MNSEFVIDVLKRQTVSLISTIQEKKDALRIQEFRLKDFE